MKQKNTVWRVLAILLVAFLWGGNQNAYAVKRMWAKFVSQDSPTRVRSLTFYYTEKETLGEGEYKVDTGGKVPYWASDHHHYQDKNYIETVIFDPSFADARPTSCYDWFNLWHLKTIEGIEYLNTSKVTGMHRMFRDCYKLTSLDLSNFDTSNVTDNVLYV